MDGYVCCDARRCCLRQAPVSGGNSRNCTPSARLEAGAIGAYVPEGRQVCPICETGGIGGKGWEVWDGMNKNIIYRGVAAELVRQGKTRKEAADHLGISMGTLANKLRGITPFTLDEAVALRDWLDLSCAVETLFEKTYTQGG